MRDKRSAPLFDALVQRRFQRESSFHVPGHKFGKGVETEGAPYLQAVMGIDYTEIPGLDDLHEPEGVIREAQELAAQCFGAEATFFLVGGSTVGNMAMLGAVCGRGDLVIVQRNAHKSVIHGLMLAGARAVFLAPEVDEETGIPAGVRAETVEAALVQYPQAKAVFLTNPNYYGMGVDLHPIAETVHRYGKPLLVDEAHGAHFGFHPRLPWSALQCGADAVVQSTHKMLTAMTMGAMLHVQGERVDRGLLKRRLAMLQSSSPSYPIMASLDLSRRLMQNDGANRVAEALELLKEFRARTAGLEEFVIIDGASAGKAYDHIDPFKIVIRHRAGLWSGFRLQEELAAHGVIAEMADEYHVLLACSIYTGKEDLDRLSIALERMAEKAVNDRCFEKGGAVPVPAAGVYSMAGRISEPVLMDWDAAGANSPDCTWVPLAEADGCLAAESVIPYPPGIPLLYPGETVRPEIIGSLRKLWEAGARFQGIRQDEAGCSILVVKTNGE